MRKTGNYRNLIAWRKAVALTVETYQFTLLLPADERFGLVQQMRRAAVSIPSNIAEGHARKTKPDFANFVAIALGSLRELETQIVLCKELGFVEDVSKVEANCDQVAALLYRLLVSLES